MHDAPAARRPAGRRRGAGSGRTTRRAIADRTAGSACRCRRRRSCPAAHRSAHAGPRRHRNGRPAPGCAGSRRRPASPALPAAKPCTSKPKAVRVSIVDDQVVGRGDLAVVVVALDHDDAQSGALGDRRVVGEGGRLVRGQRLPPRDARRAARRSGRSAASAPATGRRAARSRQATPASSTFFSVSATGTPSTAPSMPGPQGLQAADDVGHPHEGPGGIVDGHQVGRMRRQGFQPVQDRLLPAARHRRPAAAGPAPRRRPDSRPSSPEAMTTWMRSMPGVAWNASRVRRRTGWPAKGHIAWAGGLRSGCPGRRRRSGRCRLARPAR